METDPSPYSRFPMRVFVGMVVVVCAALALSATQTYLSMVELRNLYMEERAQEVATALTGQVRGPDRLDPQVWSRAMQETLQSGSYPWLRYLALSDDEGRTVTASGIDSGHLYLYDAPVRAPRRGHGSTPGQGRRWGGQSADEQPVAFSLRVGIDRASSALVTRKAYIHATVAGLAILALSVLAFLFVRTFRSFLRLRAAEESQRQMAALGRLSATLAHEIRNPLGAIKGLTQVVQERLPGDHGMQELMTTVVSEAERLERLVNDLLAFAKPRPMRSQEVDLHRLLTEVAGGLRVQASEKNIDIRVDSQQPEVRSFADPDGLKQVFFNVLINALEASPAGSAVEVRIEASGNRCLIEIADQGTGIGEQDPEHLFQPFVTTKTRGTGLGLSVSRQIVERLGGTIELRNRRPNGALCRISLPITTAATQSAESLAGTAAG